jgi:[ribosomal protein S5]-alanine N-acetyltransferase
MTNAFAALVSARLCVRAIEPEDWRAIHRYMSDPLVTRWLPEGVLDEARSRAFAAKNAGERREALAVAAGDASEPIGHLVFHPWGPERTWEIGWVFAREHQGRGYATEAARLLLDHAFRSLGAHRVIATCQPENPPSWRVMEKLGMRREAHFVRCIPRPGGEWWDEYFYGILADEHRAAASRNDSAR